MTKIEKSEEKYRMIIENANDIIGILNENFIIEYLNEKPLNKILGYSISEGIGKSGLDFIHPDDIEKTIKSLKEGLELGQNKLEIRFRHKNGQYIWFEATGKVFRDSDGQYKGTIILRDINERKLIEENLKASEEKYRIISEHAYDLIGILDRQFRYEYINEITFINVLGYSKSDLIGKTALDFIHPDDIELAIASMKEGFEKGEGSADIRFKHKNGHWVWLEAKGKAFLDKDGKMKAHIISRDITQKKRIEQDLRESEEKFRVIAEQSSLGITILQDGFISYANKAISEITGYTPQYFKKWSQNEFLQKIHPEDQATVIENLKRKLGGEAELSSHYNCRIITSSKEVKWIDLHSKLIKYKGAHAILATFIDISETKLAEKRLTESEANFRELYEEAPYAYLSIGSDSTILRGNKAALTLLGYSKQELMNMKVFDLYADTPSGLSRSKEIFKHFLNGEEIKNIELQMKRKNGEHIWVSLSVKPIIDKSGKVTESRSMVIDITERKIAEQKLRISEKRFREAYDRANFYKDLFTHDINNILQIINSSAELISYQLNNSENNIDSINIADIIKKQVQRGAKLVRNVQKLSEIEESRMKMEPLVVYDVLKSSIEYLSKAYSERKVNIQINCKNDNYKVQANELLQDIFDNILINAIKYNDNFNIEITINILRETSEYISYVKLEFIDNAVGISDLKKEVLFKEGFRIEKGTKGMGLGLSLVHKIIQMYNGKIWVENKIKEDFTKGCKFIILIPEYN